MKKEEIHDFIKQSKELPTLVTFYNKFREKIADPNTSAAEIARFISTDQVITSKILRTANSPFYGLMNRITTLAHAIMIIGFNEIHYIVLDMAVLNFFHQKGADIEGFDIGRLWKHSSGVAVLSKAIAKKVRYAALEEMFTTGLLHDIGKVFIYQYFPDDFQQIISRLQEKDIPIRQAEEEVLGITHTEVGQMLLQEWNLPAIIVSTAAYHHNPVLAKDKMKAAGIVHLADILCRALEIGSGGDQKIPPLNQDAWAQLGLQLNVIDEIVRELDAELKHFDIFG